MLTLVDAARCPYCARVRMVLAEKGLEWETIEVELADRPGWLWQLNPTGKVPVLQGDGWVLPESAVICEYLNDANPEPPLWPDDPIERAAGRLLVFRFDDFSGPYYALRRDEPGARQALGFELEVLNSFLAAAPYLSGTAFGLADTGYLPWVLRARDRMDVELGHLPAVEAWVARCSERPSVVAELDVVASL